MAHVINGTNYDMYTNRLDNPQGPLEKQMNHHHWLKCLVPIKLKIAKWWYTNVGEVPSFNALNTIYLFLNFVMQVNL